MTVYNWIIFGFILASFFVSLWWLFNTFRQIELQKNFCAQPLSSIAKLWRRAQFVPEDARERESLYLYRDFLRKFDESECKYPIMVKNGGVRCMTRKEYDDLCGQKSKRPFSTLILVVSIMIAVASLGINLYNKDLFMGIGLAAIMPAVQLVLAFFVTRLNREKNNYRDGIFMALKENSIHFLSITKPFIIVDAYPDRFGKDAKPLYATRGQIPEAQINETRDFIVRQKEAETQVVLRNVDNSEEIEQFTNPRHIEKPTANTQPTKEQVVHAMNTQQPTAAAQPTQPAPTAQPPRTLTNEEMNALISNLIDDALQAEVNRAIDPNTKKAMPITEPIRPVTDEEQNTLINNLIDDTLQAEVNRAINPNANQNTTPVQPQQAAQANQPEPTAAMEPARPLTDEEAATLIHNLIDDTLQAEVNREIKKANQANQKTEAIEDLPPLRTDVIAGNMVEVAPPAEDDFSLDAIGVAIDAEISKRNKKNRR